MNTPAPNESVHPMVWAAFIVALGLIVAALALGLLLRGSEPDSCAAWTQEMRLQEQRDARYNPLDDDRPLGCEIPEDVGSPL